MVASTVAVSAEEELEGEEEAEGEGVALTGVTSATRCHPLWEETGVAAKVGFAG